MSSKLIQEPPLIVLPSLVREVGLREAIVLQQVHFHGLRTDDGWVRKSTGEWVAMLRNCLSKRTLERCFAKLLEDGWVESDPEAGGATAYRIDPRQNGGADPRQNGGPIAAKMAGGTTYIGTRGTTERSPKGSSPKKILNADEEPAGFNGWLSFHSELSGRSVPREGTSYRSELARAFAALQSEGYSAEDFELASEGVVGDEFMRAGGHDKFDNVLRKSKIGGRIDDGKRARAARSSNKYAKFEEG